MRNDSLSKNNVYNIVSRSRLAKDFWNIGSCRATRKPFS